MKLFFLERAFKIKRLLHNDNFSRSIHTPNTSLQLGNCFYQMKAKNFTLDNTWINQI